MKFNRICRIRNNRALKGSAMHRCVSNWICLGLAVAALSWLAARSIVAGPGFDQVTLQVTMVCQGSAHLIYGSGSEGNDSVTISITETSVYNITNWDEENVSLELEAYQNQVSADGKGIVKYADLPPITWTYFSQQPKTSLFRLDLSTGGGEISFQNFNLDSLAKAKASGITGIKEGPGLASGIAGLTFSLIPVERAGMQVSEDRPLAEQLKFKFDAKSGNLSAHGQASRSLEAARSDGSLNGTFSLTYVVTGGHQADQPEVTVELENYKKWIPEGNFKEPQKTGNSIRAQAWVHRKGEPKKHIQKPVRMTFSLEHVSAEPGVCINWPNPAGEETKDLRFLAGDDTNPGLQIEKPELAQTKDLVTEATATISSFDYGAWGALRVRAQKADGTPVRVNFQDGDAEEISLPRDDDGNRIADAWEESKGVSGLDAGWDEVEVAGQNAKGDGLTLYEKYRGGVVFIPGRGRDYQRFNPREKVHFVVDDSQVFDFDRWARSSGTRAYRLTKAMVYVGDESSAESRRVDFNSSPEVQGRKYAVELQVRSGLKDDYDDPLQYAYTAVCDSPRGAERCRILPDRILAMIDRVVTMMNRALNNPTTDADRVEAALLDSLGIPREDILKRIANLDKLAREELKNRMVALCAIHEMSHACGVPGHLGPDGKEIEDNPRTPSCPMQYLDQRARRRFILLGELDGNGKLCSNPPDFCFSKVNVKD